jgi:hypothetical protein
MEGITFSLYESIELFREAGKSVDTVVSIGGGANPKAANIAAPMAGPCSFSNLTTLVLKISACI